MTDLITRERLRDWRACYPDKRIAKLIPEGGLPLADVLRLDIPAADRIWVAAQPGALPESTLCRWLGIIVRRALGRGAQPDPRSLAVLPALDRGEAPALIYRLDAGSAALATLTQAAFAASAAARAAARAHGEDDPTADDTDAAAAVDAAAEAELCPTAHAAEAERSQQVADLLAMIGGEP